MSIPPKKNVLNEKKSLPDRRTTFALPSQEGIKAQETDNQQHHDDDRDFVCGDSFEPWAL